MKKTRNGAPASAITDDRFASMNSDPRFQKPPKNRAKLEIDSRFGRAFTDPRFASSSAPVDKQGKRRGKRESDSSLKSYYSVEEKKEEDSESEPVSVEVRKKVALEVSEASESEPEPESVEVRKKAALEESEASESEEDVSEASVSEATSDTDEDDDGVVYSLEDEHEASEEEVPNIDKETRRLAVVDMDWRYVKARDLYMMLNSFVPKSGQILSVAIYPSEFGLERMKEEEVYGPLGLFDDNKKNKNQSEDGDEDEDEDEDSGANKDKADQDEIDNEKLRAYEKSKLRYYFAVVECDSIATADYLYKSCDGVEFERSSNVLDLRFIPDSMEFKHPPRDVAKEAPSNYAGLEFQTQALQQTQINLSWDEDEPDRVKTLKRKFNAEQLEELELNEFLASESGSDTSESNEDEEDNAGRDNKVDKIQKKRDMYRALLEGPSGDGSDGDGDGEENEDAPRDMEVTFNTGLEDISKRILEKKDRKQESVWEARLRENRERKKLRKHRSKDSSDDESIDYDQEPVEEPDDFFIEEPPLEKKPKKSKGKSSKREKQEDKSTNGEREVTKEELELLLAADNTAVERGIKGYNMKRKKVKGKDGKKVKQDLEEDELPPVVDDPRFAKLFDSPEFALDPTNPQFKRSATYARQIAKRKQKLDEESGERNNVVPAKVLDRVDSNDRVDAEKTKLALSANVMSIQMRLQQSKAPSRLCSMPPSKKDEDSGKKMKNKNKKIEPSNEDGISGNKTKKNKKIRSE